MQSAMQKGEDFVPANLDRPYQSIHPDDVICLNIEAKLKRSGGEVHLIVPPHSGGGSSPQPNPSLIKAVARARSWYEKVFQGKAFRYEIAGLRCWTDRPLRW